jgi:hypothetical protein
MFSTSVLTMDGVIVQMKELWIFNGQVKSQTLTNYYITRIKIFNVPNRLQRVNEKYTAKTTKYESTPR